MTENLLKKPPFRFLHDIVSEVTRNTGFAQGLYTDEELNSGNIKDKDSKVAYLNKIINCVGVTLDAFVPARPLKIVAGLEPEKTNVFLQMLARAAGSGNGAEAVRRVLGGELMPAEGASPAPPPQRAPEPAPAAPEPEREPSPPLQAPPPREEFKPSGGAAAGGGSDDDEEEEAAPVRRAPARPQSARRAPPKISSKVTEVDKKEEVAAMRRQEEAKKNSLGPTILGEGDDGLSDDDEPLVMDSELGAGAGAFGGEDDPEGGGALVRDMLAAKKEGEAAMAQGGEGGEAAPKEKGIILGSRRKKKAAAAAAASSDGSGGAAGGISTDAGGLGGVGNSAGDDQGEKVSKADVSKIREHVQALVQSTNPLGKAMDMLQEDVESMQKEFQFWTRQGVRSTCLSILATTLTQMNALFFVLGSTSLFPIVISVRVPKHITARERKSYSQRIADERDVLSETATKADASVEEAEEEIRSMRKKIDSVKAAILRNDEKVAKLLAMVVTPT